MALYKFAIQAHLSIVILSGR